MFGCPFTIEEAEIDEAVTALRASIDAVARRLG
jgi:hypothetical protein